MKKMLFVSLGAILLLGISLIVVNPPRTTVGATSTAASAVVYDAYNNKVPQADTVVSNSSAEHPGDSLATSTNSSTGTVVSDSSLTSQEQILYDRNGNIVPPSTDSTSTGFTGRSTVQPTTIKRLKKGQSYLSNAFTGAGMRYSGYMFGLESTRSMQIVVNKSTFTMFNTGSTDPGFITQKWNITPSGSPYTLKSLSGYIYFGVNNPVNGSTYAVKAL
ncbi:hypothetical protein [Lacticaseibacillus mingshuiensis]|uniref:Uncharacterized protein n=1 Tax=Lacticaseibacillus mingshuiensis TaxID=2799574 RepID=A0ABW4CGA9_9LACO|nr:hypothetical protein [Lacticaseibacillus mingshuiensis]